MKNLENKRIILGVTGSIAAYKAAQLARDLQRDKLQVQVVMTQAAARFITPLTMQTISGHEVFIETFPAEHKQTLAHINLAQNADLLLIAPATANTIAKIAAGMADNLLTALYLANRAPVLVAPAMNCNMYTHPAVQSNIRLLKERGVHFIDPETGSLACGVEGQGRLAELSSIVDRVRQILSAGPSLSGLKVTITAGPTWEPIDDLRFIANRSSGKMGYALAEEARRRSAQVTLISGPTNLQPPHGVTLRFVETAHQMKEALEQELPQTQLLIMAAAVADYTPANQATGKIKKTNAELELKLTPTVDILADIGRRDHKPILIGFAAESDDVIQNARKKLNSKGLDLIVVNHINYAGGNDDRITIIEKDGHQTDFPLMAKGECARVIWDKIEEALLK
ncbi:MAG: bifunctional phosphopantothenoylcysteine decarboxylase/phosphopantothenate--cysteine ligase CoaBC [Candidatus Schekmanbacteria bacterium]|nr:bifunctional phosphopantothenoylcysteine decarboxylase/phosphopantothenate--cysteine ligase CoaBC [Candidatus Schekmanbacteria bacterium]